MHVEVLSRRSAGQFDFYEAVVIEPYSGCTEAGQTIVLRTPRSEASCGMRLSVGQEWLVTTDASRSTDRAVTYGLNLCGYNKPWARTTPADRRFLESRTVYCPADGKMSCANGTDPAMCFADPCEVADGCKEAYSCEANYCGGGCDAEFYGQSGEMVCREP